MSWITDLFKKKENNVVMSEKSFLAWTHAMESMAAAQSKALDYLGQDILPESIKDETVNIKEPLEFKPKLVLSNNTLVAVLPDGDIFTCQGTKETFEDAQLCESKEELREIMYPGIAEEEKAHKKKEAQEAAELRVQQELELQRKKDELVLNQKLLDYTSVLINSGEFEIKNDTVYMKGIAIGIPKLLLEKFVDLVDKVSNGTESKIEEYETEYKALKNFWMWTSLCPNPQSREDMFKFLKNHDFKINKHGFFFAYRMVRSVENDTVDKAYITAISSLKTQVKVWKKAAINYDVYKFEGVYLLKDLKAKKEKIVAGTCLGNLAALYDGLSSADSGQSFTDAHTGTMDIRIGQEVSMDRNDCDSNRNDACSSGLHIGNKSFGFGGNGDTSILVLINPMNAVSIPAYDSNKMRVCAYYPLSIVEGGEYNMKKFLEQADVMELGDEYFVDQVDKLGELVLKNNPKELGDKKIIAVEQTQESIQIIEQAMAVEITPIMDKARLALKSRVVKK
jgi:hypothetical protein